MVLVTVPVVDHANAAVVAVVDAGGVLVSATVGFVVLPLIVHVYVVDVLPFAFETVTRNVCVPGASAVYDFGVEHATSGEPSSEQVVFVTDPVATHTNSAFVSVVCSSGAL